MMLLEEKLRNCFSDILFDSLLISKERNVGADELLRVVSYIHRNKLVEDSLNVLSEENSLRDLIAYSIIIKQKKFNFCVEWLRESMVYFGKISSLNGNGEKIVQVEFYDMRLK